jgi:MATE family multidrug resistance protein
MISNERHTTDQDVEGRAPGNFLRHVRETFRLSVPIIIGHLGHMMMAVTDNVMVGRIGSVSLAAAGLSNVLFFLVLVMGLGISVAITPLVAQAHGAGGKRECGLVLRQGLLVCLAAGVVLFLITLVFVESLDYLDQPGAVVASAKVYMRILGFSIFPMMVFQAYKQFAEGLSVTTSAMVITLLANLVNVFVNWVCIFGHLGAPAMGLAGAGVGTLLSRIFMAAAMVMVVVRSPYLRSFDPFFSRFHIHKPMMKSLIKLGIPAGFQYVFEVSCFAGASVLIGWIGTNELAAHQIALNLSSISYMFSLGISAAATVRVGTALGRKDIRNTRMAGISAIALICLFMAFFATVFIMFRDSLPGFYISETDVIVIASQILVVAGVFQISDGVQAVSAGMLRGAMDVNVPTVITFAAYWVVGIPVGYVLGIRMGFGVTGVWTGLFMGLSTSAVLMLSRFYRISRKHPQGG